MLPRKNKSLENPGNSRISSHQKKKNREIKTFAEAVMPGKLFLFFCGLTVFEYPVGKIWLKFSVTYALFISTSYTLILIYNWPILMDLVQSRVEKFNTSVFYFLFYSSVFEFYATVVIAWIRSWVNIHDDKNRNIIYKS